MKKHLLFTSILFSILLANATSTGYLGTVIRNYDNSAVKGVQIIDIVENSAASAYGLKDNDIITSVNGVTVQDKDELVKLVNSHMENESLTISYIRNGTAKTNIIRLGSKPVAKSYKISKGTKADGEHWGFLDDKTELILDANNNLTSLIQTDENGKITTWNIKNSLSKEMPQNFPDLQDKLSSIAHFKKQHDKDDCNCSCTVYNFTLFKSAIQTAPAVELSASWFPEKFIVYPNPASGKFSVNVAGQKTAMQLSVMDINGRVIKTVNVQNFDGNYSEQFDLSNEAKGTYLVQLNLGGKLATQKIVLQ